MSPQRAHAGPLRRGISSQQTSQIGTESRRGRGWPQRLQEAGRSTETAASTGLRSTRATARHAEVAKGGTSLVSEPKSLRKTHLFRRSRRSYLICLPVSRNRGKSSLRNQLNFPCFFLAFARNGDGNRRERNCTWLQRTGKGVGARWTAPLALRPSRAGPLFYGRSLS